MSSLNNTKHPLNHDEWEELNKLKDNISTDLSLSSVGVDEFEKFTELFVRSLEDKGNYPHNQKTEPTNY